MKEAAKKQAISEKSCTIDYEIRMRKGVHNLKWLCLEKENIERDRKWLRPRLLQPLRRVFLLLA